MRYKYAISTPCNHLSFPARLILASASGRINCPSRLCHNKRGPPCNGAPPNQERRHIVTNIEAGDPRSDDAEHCGHNWGVPSSTHGLLSYYGRIGERLAHVLLDSGATQNYVAAGFLRKKVMDAAEDHPGSKVTLTDGT